MSSSAKRVGGRTVIAPVPLAHGGVFKTKAFAHDATARGIPDGAICNAIERVEGTGRVNLGGGVYKVRLNDNLDRAIILHKVGVYWICAALFQKSAQENISSKELTLFKVLAKAYQSLSVAQFADLLKTKELIEVCHEQDY